MAKILAGGVDGWRELRELPFQLVAEPLKLRKDGRYGSVRDILVLPGSDFGRNQRVAVELDAAEATICRRVGARSLRKLSPSG